jgi:5'-3' exoribonuclease 1
MGIPSYYKRLLDRYPALVSRRGAASTSDTTLYFDFNCLVYQCLRDKALPPYDGTREWEDVLIAVVCKYVRHVWHEAGSPAHVFLAVDGVVPMAKIRQQRQRRFKSAWLAAEEVRVGARDAAQLKFDTNAITPGTAFMDRLASALEALAASHPGWSVSTSHEAGEGEQKITERIRAAPPKHAIVYGLDGDLIVLSLLHADRVGGWLLMREAGEFGIAGAEPNEFVFLDIQMLRGILESGGTVIKDYCAAMSLLGNDFLPHSLSVKLRDGGHDELLRTLRGRTIVQKNGDLDLAAFREIWKVWAGDEAERIAAGFAHKYKMRGGPPKNDYDRAMVETNNLPIAWAEEKCVWGAESGLRPDWVAQYRRWCFDAAPQDMTREYIYGLRWIWDYYNGRSVDKTWYYPWLLSPLWSDLVAADLRGAQRQHDVVAPITEQEQLAMVLPRQSWGLLRDSGLRGFPERAPAFWPDGFGFFSVGRRWFWECEALIPILSIRRLRAFVRR